MTMPSISRRRFAQLLTAGAGYAVIRPTLSLAKSLEPAAHGSLPPPAAGVVRLSANENPYGPCPAALKAMTESFPLACRYPDEHADVLVRMLAESNQVDPSQILLGDGSGEILQLCATTFTGPQNGILVAADPTFEAVLKHAAVNGADVVRVPLTTTFSHDLPKMSAVAKKGLVYICNPNNPTASITPRHEMRDFVAKAPRETTILVDEAYFHYADNPDYESVIPLVKEYPNLIVARTFSKIYGMAGLRCGYCVGRREVIDRLRPHQAWDSVNIVAIAAAVASLGDTEQVATGRRLNAETKTFLTNSLDALGYRYIPSEANFVMIDLKRPVPPVIAALKERGVQVGRLFPALPHHLRVTVGKKPEMEGFLSGLREVMV